MQSLAIIAYLDISSPIVEDLIVRFATSEDHHRATQRKTPNGQRQSLATRVLLRAVLSDAVGSTYAFMSIVNEPDQAPRLAMSGVTVPTFVSLAHSGAIAACAVTTMGRIGIDIEILRSNRPFEVLSHTTFGPREHAQVMRDGGPAFYRIWTLREAFAKATGEGFGLLVNGLDLVSDVTDGCLERQSFRGTDWARGYWTIPEGYGLGVAIETSEEVTLRPQHFRD